jgi:glycosyltransferase involved in cell wall biosynthesis
MKILLLGPQPHYQDRGTPIAVSLVLKALSEHGHGIDFLSYAEGSDKPLPNVRHFRIADIPLLRGVGPGPSVKKILCDVLFFFSATKLMLRKRYAVVHAVEESVFMALAFKILFRAPYVYDMDSSMAQQIVEKFPALSFLNRTLGWLERLAIRNALGIVPVCSALEALARRNGATKVLLLSDVSLLSLDEYSGTGGKETLDGLGIGRPRALYVGNLEHYQGLDLLLESFAIAVKSVPRARLVVIGGSPASLATYRARAEALGLRESCLFLGPKPVAEIGHWMSQAEVVVSPRVQGNNTPMKIYSYLDSGAALLATDLPTHTQVLSSSIAHLRKPEPTDFAAGLAQLLEDGAMRSRLAAAAKREVSERHGYPAFREALVGFYRELEDLLAEEPVSAPATVPSGSTATDPSSRKPLRKAVGP